MAGWRRWSERRAFWLAYALVIPTAGFLLMSAIASPVAALGAGIGYFAGSYIVICITVLIWLDPERA